ncbi:Beta-glucosidase BoGH3B [Linum grandiflorum]
MLIALSLQPSNTSFSITTLLKNKTKQMASSSSLYAIAIVLIIIMNGSSSADEQAPITGRAEGYLKYKDPRQPIKARIKDLLGRMSLAEKIGQMVQIDRSVTTQDVMKEYFIGSVISVDTSVPDIKPSDKDPHNNVTARRWVYTINEIQNAALSTRLGIPMLFGVDAVHGNCYAYNATIFPHNIALGVTRDPELVKRIGAATAIETRATGARYVFTPSLAVCRDPRWGRCYESYSEDPNIVRQMTDIITGLQGDIPPTSRHGVPFVARDKTKVAACAKQYVGDGGTVKGIDRNDTFISWDGLVKIHMMPYVDAVYKGVATIMIGYSSWNGKKMHANRDLITSFLKEKLHFQGIVISDWLGVDRITTPEHANYSNSIEAALLAGIDMVMIPYEFREFIRDLTYQVEKNIIPMSRIDDAVSRILRVKFAMGLFESPLGDLTLTKELGKKEHRELAREAVRKSLVLLKNGKSSDQPLIPLPKNAKQILVAGSHAHNLGLQCGGWTIDWQGRSGNNLTSGTTILEAVTNAVDPSTKVVYKENPTANFVRSNDFSYAIVVVGEQPYAEIYGDSLNLTIPADGLTAIENVCGAVRCVVILVAGRPLVIQPFLAKIDAFVAAWLPGTEGQGVADVLFGDYGFTGKLARTWFKSVDQLPMNIGDPHYDPLFPFGFGLTTQPNNTRNYNVTMHLG